MKQTNNAIKFLMAQYRAVFKSAYVSGITTAVALTSFLAAAQANAAPSELKVDNWVSALEASDTLVINGETTTDPAKGEYSKLNITSAVDKTLTLSDKQKLSLVGDKVSDAKISVTTQGKTLSLTGEGALEVDAKNGLTIEATASGSNANVDLGTVNIKKGTLTLKASDAKATVNLAANSIVIGNGESGEGATVTLSGAGTNVLGGTSSSIVVKGNGQVVTKDSGNSIQGSSLVAEKGSKFTFDGTTDYKVQSSTFTSSTIEVAAGGTLNVDLAEIGTGKPGQMTITGAEKETSKVNVGGTLNINTGVVTIDKHVELKSSAATGTDDKIVIGDNDAQSKDDKAIFKISKDTLNGFLTGTNKGSVHIQSGGTLYITDEVVLNTDLTFAGTVTDGAISQANKAGGALGGSNIVITEAVTKGTNIAIKADKITFGVKPEDKNQTAQPTDFATGVGHLEAKNVEIAGKSHTLQDTLILRNVAVADDKATAGEGKISGNLILGKAATNSGDLEVDGGKFNYTSGDMTLVSGSITVKNSLSGKGAVSSLTFDKDTKIIITGSSNPDFTAKATGEGSVLDISKAKLEASGAGTNATIFSAVTDGRLVISNEQVKAVAEAKTNPLQSVKFEAGEKGTLAFSDAVTLELGTGKANPISVADITTSGTGQTIGGTLEANSGLTINYSDSTTPQGAHYAVSGTLVASTLTLSAKKNSADEDFKLGDGVYKLSSGLAAPDSAKDKFVVISGSAATGDHTKSQLLLGAVSTNEKGELVTSKGGSATNIEVQANGIVGVQSGEWNGKKLKVTNGSFTIGYKDTTGDKTANAAFNGTELTVAKQNGLTINRGSSAKFETVIGGATGAIQVSGSLTITGKEKTNPITAASSQTGIVAMGANSEVTLGTEAVKNAITKVSGDTVDFNTNFAGELFTMGKNATFNLDLGALATDKEKTITISATGLNKLKDKLFKDYDANTNSQLTGFINIGKADIDGLSISGDKVSWTDYKNFQDTISSVTSDKLSKATVTDVDGNFKGSVGAVALKTGTNTLTVDGNTILANASGNSGFFVSSGNAAGAITISGQNVLTLSGGGKAGAITLNNGNTTDKTTLVVTSKDGAPLTELAGISGENSGTNNAVQIVGKTKVTGTINNIVDLEIGSELEVTANVTVENLKSLASKGVALKMEGKDLTVSGDANFAGDITAKNATFSNTGAKLEEGEYDAKLGGNNTIEKLSFSGHGMINNGGTTKVTDTLTVADKKSVTVAQGATLDAKHITLAAKNQGATQLIVGQDSKTVKNGNIDVNIGSSTGYLVANTVKLNGGDLIADPDFGGAASIVSVAGFGAANTDLTKNAGTIDGKAIALQNSILAVGVGVEKSGKTLEKLQELFADYLDPKTGSLSSEGYGSIMYVAKNVTVEDAKGKLIIDPKRGLEKYNKDMDTQSGDQAYKDAINNDAYIGEGAALAVSADAAVHSFDENTKAQNAAIKFNKNGATIYAEKNSTVLLTGDFSSMDNIKLFADTDNTNAGVMINGNDLKATTLSGVYEFIMKKDQPTDANGFQLNVNNDVLDKSYHDASHPARNTIVAYAKKEFANGTKLHGDLVAGVTFDEAKSEYKNTDGTVLTGADIKNLMHIGDKVYTKVNNRFLENITQNLNYGHDVDTITRLGAYSGVAHSAIAAGNVTTNAVAARFAIGSSPVDFIAAQNNMGGSAFVAPMMNQFESDGFDSEGVSYGVDVDTTGVAFGGDFEFTPQLRAGVLFNIGSGDAKGKGQASTASSDFDFYGLSVYAGYNVDRFAVVADVSYTKIDNEVKAFITDETIKADSSATNMSLGVNAQYTFDFNQMAVTPHMGLRYSMIEADDYSITDAGSFSSDKMSVISVPVGVTIAQAYASDNWIVTPYADFTVTGNFGDNSYKGSFKWANVANLTTDTDTEVMDNFSYGLTLGINGETGNLGMSAGLNYTSSSNTDNLGFSASCRYLF